MDWNSYLLILIGIAVGLTTGGVFWVIWQRTRSDSSHTNPNEEARPVGESLQLRLDELTILHAIATAGAEATDEDVLIERVTQIIGENLYPNNFGTLLMDEQGERLRTHPSYREHGKLKGPEWIPIGEGISGQVADWRTQTCC